MGFNRRKVEDQRWPGRADLSTPRTVRILRIPENSAVPHAFAPKSAQSRLLPSGRQNKIRIL
jgi:hypothetical protein